MPYSHITRTAFGTDAIAYARGDGTGHNGAEVRNEYIAGVNMLPDEVVPFEWQMRPFGVRAHSRHTVQVDRCIVSFHPSELNPDKPEDCVKGLAIGCEIARRNAPDNQSAVFLQKDGVGGKIHLHILTNDVNMSDYRGIDSSAYAHFHFQQIVDEVCQQYFDLAKPEAQPERVNPSVRGSRMKNEQIRAANELERQQAAAEGREVDPDKIIAERYIWQDDLRQRVKDAAARATDEDSFAHQLRLSGVELVPYKNKDEMVSYLHPATKKQPAHYTYELVDTSGFPDKIPPNLKSKSYKLGTNYQPEEVAKLFGTSSPSVQDDQQDEAPAVAFEPPRWKPKTAKKPAKEAPEESLEDKAMADAKNIARTYALTLMRQVYGWPKKPPKLTGPDGREWTDFGELDRQYQERDAAFEQFTQWRVDWRKELAKHGKKLPGIYVKNKDSGYVSVPRDEFDRQFTEFLDWRDHPEKYEAVKEQPEQQAEQIAPVEQPQTGPKSISRAEQERQENAKNSSIFSAELQKLIRKTKADEQWRKELQQEGGEKDTVVKS